MKETRIIMGMPVTVEIVNQGNTKPAIGAVFDYFNYIDEKFSTFKQTSEITKINKGLITPAEFSADMKTVFELSEKTKQETDGYFDIVHPVRGQRDFLGEQINQTSNGANKVFIDPSGLVKGWAIFNAAGILKNLGFADFYVEAGGDIQVSGKNSENKSWSVGIKNPFKPSNIVKTVYLKNNEGIATSGSYERGNHIYNPKERLAASAAADAAQNQIVSLTVIGKNIYEADRFATAAFAMQRQGIHFIEKLIGFEGYAIDRQGIATMTSGFEKYTKP